MPTKKTSGTPEPSALLRRQAEQRLAKLLTRKSLSASKDPRALLHELQVHQVELEMQNENLRDMHLWLAEARDRYLDLFQFAPVAYLSVNLDQAIQEANLTAAGMLVAERKQLVGSRLAKWVARGHRDDCSRHLQAALQSASKETCELPILRGDGSEFLGHLEIMPIKSHESGKAAGWRVTISDVTARKRVEEELARTKEAAEKASLAKSRFLANVSHELRTPMNAILGMTQLALNDELSPAVRDYLETVMQSSESLLELLNDLLDFSRIEEGRLELESVAFSLRKTVNQVLKCMSVRALEKGLELSGDLSDDVPDNVLGDPSRLRQVLVNLVGNAVKFTERGSVTIRVRKQSESKEKVDLLFSVADTGIGISAQEQQKIFAPFTQADPSTTRSYGGTGLGLAISADLVKLMGGKIWVESRLGAGSTFYCTVRLKPAPAAAGPVVRREAAHDLLASRTTRPLHVLVAEDVPPNQKLVAAILRKRGHEVTLANDGREAVDAATQQHFDVILLDVQMPVVDGFQAAVAIRKLDPAERRPPLVAMTAYAMKGDVERCITSGFDDYLGKPFRAEELIRMVEGLADQGTSNQAVRAPKSGRRPRLRYATAEARLDPAHENGRYLEAARKRCYDDTMFDEMVAFFFQESPSLLRQMRISLAEGNAVELVRAVHRLKSTVGYLGSPAAAQAVTRVEEIGLSGSLANAPPAIEQLEAEMKRLNEVLAPCRPQEQRQDQG